MSTGSLGQGISAAVGTVSYTHLAITSRAVKAGLDVKHAGEVNDLAKAGNEVARQIMDDAKEYLANFIGVVYGYADPEIVILGGSVALKIDGFVEEVEALAKERVYEIMKPYVKVRKSTRCV